MADKLGGWSEAKKATEETQKICDQVKHEVEKKTGKNYAEFKAYAYRQQVVSGTNYLIRVNVDHYGCTDVQVFKGLPCNGGKVELKGFKEYPIQPFPPSQ